MSEKFIELIENVDSTTIKARTRTLDVSFNELFDMFKSEELKISPDFQRLFRWSEAKQSQFIESLILELPIPPIYVMEVDNGVYELIDGLQRISSYFHFRGIKASINEENGDFSGYLENEYLMLTGCDIIESLNGLTYKDLPSAIQIKLKRHFIRMEVLRRESDVRLKYHMFKRLNTGGEKLSEQEIRNCTIRLLDNTFNEFLKSIVKDTNYKLCMSGLTEEKQKQMYLEEYALRFFSVKNYRTKYVKNVGDFLTEYMEAISDSQSKNHISFDYESEKNIFITTFKVLYEILGDLPFSGFNQRGNSQGNFSSLSFDSITIGIQTHLEKIKSLIQSDSEKIKDFFISLKKDTNFQTLTKGGGKNYSAALERRIKFVDDWFSKCLS